MQWQAALDPASGLLIRAGEGLPHVAVDPLSGTIDATWMDHRFTADGEAAIAVASSTDAGRTWSAPIRVNGTPAGFAAFTPSVSVASGGSVGVGYYDLRDESATDQAINATYWFATCHMGCDEPAHWTEVRVTPPFDLRAAPWSSGLFLGDYDGVVATGNAFALLFAQSLSHPSTALTELSLVIVTPPAPAAPGLP